MIQDLKTLEAWFVTGSQSLYGEETLRQVDKDSNEIANLRGKLEGFVEQLQEQ